MNRSKPGGSPHHGPCPRDPNPCLTSRRDDLFQQGSAGPWIDNHDLRQLDIPLRQTAKDKGQSAQRSKNGPTIDGAARSPAVRRDEAGNTHRQRRAAVLPQKVCRVPFCANQHHGRGRAVFQREGRPNISASQATGEDPSKAHEQDGHSNHQNRR